MKDLLKYRQYFILFGIVLAVAVIIYFTGRRAGKKASDNPWQAPLPTDIGNGSGPSSVDWAKIRSITDDLFSDLEKLDWIPMWGTRVIQVYEQWNSLSDTEFVAVYNDFNSRFSSRFSGKSVVVILKDEWSWGSSAFNSLRASIISRCERLKLV
jgi:hypothetical protein